MPTPKTSKEDKLIAFFMGEMKKGSKHIKTRKQAIAAALETARRNKEKK